MRKTKMTLRRRDASELKGNRPLKKKSCKHYLNADELHLVVERCPEPVQVLERSLELSSLPVGKKRGQVIARRDRGLMCAIPAGQ